MRNPGSTDNRLRTLTQSRARALEQDERARHLRDRQRSPLSRARRGLLVPPRDSSRSIVSSGMNSGDRGRESDAEADDRANGKR
jgi:hypothetical protein